MTPVSCPKEWCTPKCPIYIPCTNIGSMFYQTLGNMKVSLVACAMKCGAASKNGGGMNISTTFQQMVKNVKISMPACSHKWCMAIVIMNIHIGAMSQQPFHHRKVALVACPIEGRFAGYIHGIDIHSSFHQFLDSLQITIFCCSMDIHDSTALLLVNSIASNFERIAGWWWRRVLTEDWPTNPWQEICSNAVDGSRSGKSRLLYS